MNKKLTVSDLLHQDDLSQIFEKLKMEKATDIVVIYKTTKQITYISNSEDMANIIGMLEMARLILRDETVDSLTD